MSETSLQERRKKASEESLGQSHQVIYDKFIEVVRKSELSGKVLDFGAGQGDLVRRLMDTQLFEEVSATDLMARPENLDESIQWHQVDLNEESLNWDGQFDVIVSAEVIEHLENPREVARTWFRWLKPGGHIVMSTPNNESWRSLLALVLRGHFVDFGDKDYPAHITALVHKDMERILQEASFINTRFCFTDHGGLPKKPSLSWQKISAGWLKGKRYSDNVLVIAEKPT